MINLRVHRNQCLTRSQCRLQQVFHLLRQIFLQVPLRLQPCATHGRERSVILTARKCIVKIVHYRHVIVLETRHRVGHQESDRVYPLLVQQARRSQLHKY